MGSVELVARPRPSGAPLPGAGWSRFASGIRGEGTAARRAWQSSYVQRTVLFDVLCAVLAAVASYVIWFGSNTAEARPPAWEVVALPLMWLPAMVVARTHEERFLWVG